MQPADPIPTALEEIAAILRQQKDFDDHAADIEELRISALSRDKKKREWFRSEIIGNKWYWGGMGTIADVQFRDHQLNRRYMRAYYRLATACEEEGI